MQVKLLRVLNDHVYTPLGEKKPRKAKVRILAATNQDVQALIASGDFREDFFHRLHVITLTMPPLRLHTEDVPQIIAHFFAQNAPQDAARFPSHLRARFMEYDWPGNVRELFNELRRWTSTGEVEIGQTAKPSEEPDTSDLQAKMEHVERQTISAALARHNGNRTRTAEALKISTMTLHRKINKYGLE